MGNKAERERPEVQPVPKKGDIIYLPGGFYSSQGMDNKTAGQAFVTRVFKQMSGGKLTPFVITDVLPESQFNWEYLGPIQEELKEKLRDSLLTIESKSS